MAKTLCLGLVCGVVWLASVGAGAWLLQRYGLAPRPSDFERLAFFRRGLQVAEMEISCLGLRPRWREWHQHEFYVGLLFFAPPQTCEEVQGLMERADPVQRPAQQPPL